METRGKRLARLRRENQLTQTDVADKCGVKKASVSAWELDKTNPSLESFLILRQLYDVTLDELVLGHLLVGSSFGAGNKIPHVEWRNSRNMSTHDEIRENNMAINWLPCAEPHSEYTFALSVKGHSMASPVGRSYPEDTIIYCDPIKADKAESGQRVLAYVPETDSLTFKELVIEDGRRWLRPLNPDSQYTAITSAFDVIALVIGTYMPE